MYRSNFKLHGSKLAKSICDITPPLPPTYQPKCKTQKELRHVDCNSRFVRTILAFRFDLFHSNQTEKLCQIESQLHGKCD